ncbi:DUF3347 domain-containing protein [Pedobacter sandarakinus]|uniref:DUF3347 domain-containing protein n=1 Tax=Pedobacter sandarakinus TaxID=353156 RepID=UPI002247089A|nr:DUF3347 domain-containing protein [Pedobacter sandarakinus]MCX2574210.1 DUF3347 domain-containing protein [Pedobacter sandarakinus]
MKRLFGLSILATLLACGQSEHKSSVQRSDSTNSDSSAKINVVSFKEDKKNTTLEAYISLKDALVKSDEVAAQGEAVKLQRSLAKLEGCELTAEIAQRIASTQNLADQRKNFTALSADLIALMKSSALENGTLYIQHCPMANKGDGGDWLSTAKDIKNPYYGDQMLECGRVIEEIKSN